MFGFIHCAWADMITSRYGEELWQTIVSESGIELGGGSFLIHKHYADEDTWKMFDATSKVLKMSRDKCLEQFGDHFFKYCMDTGYDRVLRVLGGNLMDFLCNLDALHDHFDSIYPGLRAPSFRCTATDDGGLLLHYYSKKTSLYPVVKGIVKAASSVLYNVKVKVELKTKLGSSKDHKVLYIHEENVSGHATAVRKRSSSLVSNYCRHKTSSSAKDFQMNTRTFCRAFPFHIMFNRRLEIVQAGKALTRVLKLTTRLKEKLLFTDLFHVQRPAIDINFNSILGHINTVFAVQTKSGALQPSSDQNSDNEETVMRLKGQMIYVPESDSILFLCSPRVCNLDDLKGKGLFLSDIPLHDATRDLILITQARRHERELVEKLEDTSNNLKKLQSKLQDDKKRTDELLHSILPSEVANKLRLNQPVDAEKFELVTILFADIVSFTTLCGNPRVAPMDIVRMLNRLYTQFDMLSSLNGVHKVETIGDAYMVVSGIPYYTEHHADNVVSMAFGMVDVAGTVTSPVDKKPIQIRIGLHTGPCVAGVVGLKMPRYCLFGNTVTMASLMEAGSLPGRINISHITKRYLKNPEVYTFEENHSSPQTDCECYIISQTAASPKPVLMDLSLPVPKGMFRTPNPSPPLSRLVSPCESPQRCTSPVRPNSPERPGSAKETSPGNNNTKQTPAITICDAEEELSARAQRALDIGTIYDMESHLRKRLMSYSTKPGISPFSPTDVPCYQPGTSSTDRFQVPQELDLNHKEVTTPGTPKIIITDAFSFDQTDENEVVDAGVENDFEVGGFCGNDMGPDNDKCPGSETSEAVCDSKEDQGILLDFDPPEQDESHCQKKDSGCYVTFTVEGPDDPPQPEEAFPTVDRSCLWSSGDAKSKWMKRAETSLSKRDDRPPSSTDPNQCQTKRQNRPFGARKFSSPASLPPDKSSMNASNGMFLPCVDLESPSSTDHLVIYFRGKSRAQSPDLRRRSAPVVRERRARTPEPFKLPFPFK